MTNVLHKSISFKNKTVTSNHISLDAIVSRSKPELPVVSACSTLSLSPLEVPGRLSGWLHARFPIPRSSTGSSAPTHGIPDTELSTSMCRLQLPKQKELECCSLVLCQNFTESLSVGDSVRCAGIPHTNTHTSSNHSNQ